MKTTRAFQDADRYIFDFDICNFKKGWAQVDTSQDASYYGNWANPITLTLMSYIEGDITKHQAETQQEFKDELMRTIEWHKENDYWKGIDCMCSDEITKTFVDMGFDEYLY
jgi:hypothetical protein